MNCVHSSIVQTLYWGKLSSNPDLTNLGRATFLMLGKVALYALVKKSAKLSSPLKKDIVSFGIRVNRVVFHLFNLLTAVNALGLKR